MLIAAIIALWSIFGGGGIELYSVEHLTPLIEQHVAAGERQDRLFELIEANEKQVTTFNDMVAQDSETLLELNRNYQASVDDFSQLHEASQQRLKKMQKEMIDFRFAMQASMTRAEWSALFP